MNFNLNDLKVLKRVICAHEEFWFPDLSAKTFAEAMNDFTLNVLKLDKRTEEKQMSNNKIKVIGLPKNMINIIK